MVSGGFLVDIFDYNYKVETVNEEYIGTHWQCLKYLTEKEVPHFVNGNETGIGLWMLSLEKNSSPLLVDDKNGEQVKILRIN